MKTQFESVKLIDYEYSLPEERIAKYPLDNRSSSKLLVYRGGEIKHEKFKSIADYIYEETTIFFNNTKVIPARLHFRKDTGALIEIFLLEPLKPTNEVAQAMLVNGTCTWRCMVGNFKKWKNEQNLMLKINIGGSAIVVTASIKDRGEQIIQFSWQGNRPFVDIVSEAGKIPLPPYINRDVEESDKDRYQTVYSEEDGAVAAPTAGLHFTEEVIQQLESKGNKIDYLTLHVSAGTFQPIKVDNAVDHNMHSEQIVLTLQNLNSILHSKQIVAVGTTSMRTLESLYWYGVKLLKTDDESFRIAKLDPYQYNNDELPELRESVLAVKNHMLERKVETITGSTEIFIFPGYTFRVCKGLITNFHLPGSTLILLIAAFIGKNWKKVYEEALNEDYRFLSYGDSSILIPEK